MIDLSKPVQTRDGRKARIICVNKKGYWPIVALVDREGAESVETYHQSGRFMTTGETDSDLINIPETKEWYVNVYPSGPGAACPSLGRGSNALAVLKITATGAKVAAEVME